MIASRLWSGGPVAALVVAAGCLAGPAAAQDTPAGTFVIKNTSGEAVKFKNMAYTDAYGTEKTIDASWEIPAGAFSRLVHKDESIVARKVAVELVTAAGSTTLTWTCRGVDADGHMICTLTADDIATHLKLLGKQPVVRVALKPPAAAPRAAGPTQKQVEDGVTKTVAALLVQVIIIEGLEAEPDPGFLTVVALQVARKARDEIVGSAVKDLFPQLTAGESDTVRRMVSLAADGRLTKANLNKLEAKESLIAQLRKANPDIGAAAEVADFLAGIQAGMQASRR